MITITTVLCAGTPEEAAERDNTLWTTSPDVAIHFIEEGGTAFIPLEEWELTAEAILKRWSTQDQIADAISFARTGKFPKENAL